MIKIRQSIESDLQDILHVVKSAFPDEQGNEVAELTQDLLNDPTAKPYLSLLAEQNEKPVGYILFTHVEIIDKQTPSTILAPLAVFPEFQSQGVGGKLIQEGIKILTESGTNLVFVLGHTDYYPRHGFTPAEIHGLEAPYPIPEEYSDGWMVRELSTGLIGQVKGKIKCANALNDPKHWIE
jgi:putative acetyltransferase